MKKQSLLETNPYLKNREVALKLIERSVVTSCGVEGIKVDLEIINKLYVPKRSKKRIADD